MSEAVTPVISDYNQGGFTIGEDFHDGSILITGADEVGFTISPWSVRYGDELEAKDLDPIYDSKDRPMLILIGVGPVMTHPYAKLRAELSKQAIAVEIQTTQAACRTWNLLLSEGRKVAFAAMAIPAEQLPTTTSSS